ncbi:MAG: hypothetical protein AAGG56_16725 [Pseudomonadota bacterium]
MKGICLGLATVGLLAACSNGPDVLNRNLPIVALADSGEEIVAPPINFARPVIRSYVPGEAGEWVLAPGAQCDVAVGPYTAVATTPSRLVVPDLRPASIPLVATCTMGEFAGRAEFESIEGFDGPYAPLAVGMLQSGAAQ